MLAAIGTLGFGGAMGLEGPSLYLGASIGAGLQARFYRLFRSVDHRVLMVAGAAAGVAAIFKAPATGAVFALEVPYQDDFARKMLLPALVAAASGYLAFVAVHGTAPSIPSHGSPPSRLPTSSAVSCSAQRPVSRADLCCAAPTGQGHRR